MEDLTTILLTIFNYSENNGIVKTIIILCFIIIIVIGIKPLGNKIGNYIFKFVTNKSNQIHNDSLKRRKLNIFHINNILEDLRTYFHCERSLIFEYHNGGTNLSGLSFLHMSATFEKNVLGLQPIAQNFQKLALSLFPNLISDLENDDCLFVDVAKNKNKYLILCSNLEQMNIKSCVIVPIYGVEDSIGFVILCSEKLKELKEENKLYLHKEAQRISILLDYKRYIFN